jgi:hypothetical protein
MLHCAIVPMPRRSLWQGGPAAIQPARTTPKAPPPRPAPLHTNTPIVPETPPAPADKRKGKAPMPALRLPGHARALRETSNRAHLANQRSPASPPAKARHKPAHKPPHRLVSPVETAAHNPATAAPESGTSPPTTPQPPQTPSSARPPPPSGSLCCPDSAAVPMSSDAARCSRSDETQSTAPKERVPAPRQQSSQPRMTKDQGAADASAAVAD